LTAIVCCAITWAIITTCAMTVMPRRCPVSYARTIGIAARYKATITTVIIMCLPTINRCAICWTIVPTYAMTIMACCRSVPDTRAKGIAAAHKTTIATSRCTQTSRRTSAIVTIPPC
jgi:hypothetical protein